MSQSLSKVGNDIKKALLTGVSYMIPFVIPGGILIAVGFAIGGIYVFETPGFAADIFAWGKVAFGLMIPALGGYIAFSLADRPGIAPGFVAGMIANNQGSGFLGAMIGGIIAGYLVNYLKKIPVPVMLKSLLPTLIIPLFGTFFVGVIMTYIIGVPVTWLNNTMTEVLGNMTGGSLIVLGIIQGAMLAFDMGGPVNKAAYAFALAASSAGNWAPMAANFVASMSPPMGLAIAMLIAKKKFTDMDRKSIGGCVIGGCAMITEFAIPFAAKDPLRVIPSLMVGSAVGAALSYAAGLTLQAPHGGMFVIFLANRPLVWLGVFAIASLVTAGMLLLLKKDVKESEEEVDTEALNV
ncbi:MAG TPA: PTS fructose transporter subunit IIC [Anaerovoracaceae bacterium]|nr:PTS fructose transporter subunit IIC [Anaerovoracaceae bacterium]